LQNTFELAVMVYDSVGSGATLERWLASPQSLADRGETPVETRA
jgi:hypothetical protein